MTEAFAEVLSGATSPTDPADGRLRPRSATGSRSRGDGVAEAEALAGAVGRIVLSQFTESLHARRRPLAAPDAGLVSEELLHRSIRSNVELAEALAGLVRDMNLGLGTILSHAELLLLYKDEAREKRAAAIDEHPAGGDPSARAGPGAGQRPRWCPRRTARRPPCPTTEPVAGKLRGVPARGAAPTAPRAPDDRKISVDLRIPAGTLPPNCPHPTLHRALAETFEGLAGAMTPHSQVFVRCERKPVLLRAPEGEVKKDFLMVALAHNGTLTASRISRGSCRGSTMGRWDRPAVCSARWGGS